MNYVHLSAEVRGSLSHYLALKVRRDFPFRSKHILPLEEENLRLKKLVTDLSLDKAMLQDVLAKRTDAGTPA